MLSGNVQNTSTMSTQAPKDKRPIRLVSDWSFGGFVRHVSLHKLTQAFFTGRIDHFHYDVTRAKVSGSCSKDRVQCRAIAGKCQKSAEAPGRPKQATRRFTKLCARLLHKFKEIQHGVFFFFFSINEELRSVVNKHFNGKLFSQILDTECVAGKRVLTMLPIQFPSWEKESKGRREFLR